MFDPPVWFNQLVWGLPWSVAALRARIKADQNPIPDRPGCYVFTGDAGDTLVRGAVLYVGKAMNLRTRLRGYLVDYMKTAPSKHKGKVLIFDHRHQHGDDNCFVRWTMYGDPIGLEGALIVFLNPLCNDKIEEVELGDDESLDSRFVFQDQLR
jgi:hypothetical protein